jgi:Flp pilus assembly protein TadG
LYFEPFGHAQGHSMRSLRSPSTRGRRPRFTGQSIVEFALISLVLMMITYGILDFGRAVIARTMLTNAVREALRAGMVASRSDTAVFQTTVVSAAQRRSPMLGLAASHFTTVACSEWSSSSDGSLGACAPATSEAGDRLTVCANYQFNLAAAGVIRIPPIQMRECARVPLQ